jgi:hypothetical protein
MEEAIDELMRKLREGVAEDASHHSKLGLYMAKNPDSVREMVQAAGEDCEWIARALAVSGLQDHTHAAPAPATARETWQRVEERRRAGLKLRSAKE